MLTDITYIGDRSLDEQLGCPVETHGCFYSFADDAGGACHEPCNLGRAPAPSECPGCHLPPADLHLPEQTVPTQGCQWHAS